VNISDELLGCLLSIECSAPAFKTALSVLALSPDEANLCYVTTEDLAAVIGGSAKTAQRHLAEAVSAGLLVERYTDTEGAVFGPPDVD
jgi:hypothetical protein